MRASKNGGPNGKARNNEMATGVMPGLRNRDLSDLN